MLEDTISEPFEDPVSEANVVGHHRPSAVARRDARSLGRVPNRGVRYPADPPTVEEIISVMRQAGSGAYADRIRGLIAILWRAGLGESTA
jgi:hypothetical protein